MNISPQASLPSSRSLFATSWSGGKDGCFARWISSQSGAKPACLLTMLREGEQRTSAHGLHQEVLQTQADCLGTPIIFGSAGFGGYEQGLKKALATAISEYSASHLAFGDIDLDAHKDWYDRILKDTSIQTCYPLWHYSRKQLLKDMFSVGQEALIVSIKNESLDQSFLGRILTPSLADEIEARGICPTGEEGDFHTLVINGPDFKEPLSVKKADIWQDDWGHSVLELLPA